MIIKSNDLTLMLILVILSLAPAACHTRDSGPFERTGERMDEIGDNIKEGRAPLHKKGAMEKTGEAIDDMVKGEQTPLL